MNGEQDEILTAIESELNEASEYYEYLVVYREREGAVWKIFVDSERSPRSGLDESLEGASAWWPGPPKGGADVLSVIPENEQINLRFATTEPPDKEGRLRIYPPRYLEALKQCWQNGDWASLCLAWRDALVAGVASSPPSIPFPKFYPWLRRAQCAAFDLLRWQSGFLWGPPGTGKTTTIGAIMAQYLIQFPQNKVLVAATTNSAVDQALVAVDQILEKSKHALAGETRRRCFRLGHHFLPELYRERRHLIPVKDETLVRRLVELEAQRPDKEKVTEYAEWKRLTEEIRTAIRRQSRDVMTQARLAALTITRATFTISDLRDFAPFDLIVFDEISQAGIPHALSLCPLARQAVFAGDPMQLAPIVQSRHPLAKKWFGESMFLYQRTGAPWTVMLDEQSRMAEPICRVVSNVFYDGRLRVANDKARDRAWLKERELYPEAGLDSEHFQLKSVIREGQWSAKYHGPIRYQSAEQIADIAERLMGSYVAQDVIILTPFRAQRALVRMMLRGRGIRGVRVSTVHRAQGTEHHTVLFDPAQGESDFLRTEDARRLVNVAISRAKARLVVFLSPGDRKNPLFDQLANVFEHSHVVSGAIPIGRFVRERDFPACCLGLAVSIGPNVGRVLQVLEDGRKFQLLDFTTGEKKIFSTERVIRLFGT